MTVGTFAGNVAIVTGPAGGIDRDVAPLFTAGPRVAVADITVEGGNETVRLVHGASGEARFFAGVCYIACNSTELNLIRGPMTGQRTATRHQARSAVVGTDVSTQAELPR